MSQNEASQGSSGQPANNTPAKPQPIYNQLVRPDQIQNFAFLTPEAKTSYHGGVTKLWAAVKEKPQTHPEHQLAVQKLKEMTAHLIQRARQTNSTRPAAQGGAPTQPPGPGQPPPPRPQSQGLPTPQQQQQSQQNTGQAGPQQATSQTHPQRPVSQAQAQPQAIPPEILRKVEALNVPAPAGISDPQKYQESLKRQYAMQLTTAHRAATQLRNIEQIEQQHRAQGKDLPPQLQQQKLQQQSTLQQARAATTSLENSGRNAASAAAPNQATSQPGANLTQSQQQHIQAQNAASNNRQQPGANSQPSAQPSHPQQQQTSTHNQGTAISNPAQQTRPQPHPAQVPPQGFNQGRPPPTPVNGQSFTGQTQSPSTMQPSGMQQGGPVPYNHQGALAAARNSYSHSSAQHPPGAGQPNGSAQHSRPDADRQNKPAYPSTFRGWQPNPAQPISMPPARPTMGGSGSGLPGMMGQPAIQRPPEFALHGGGDRVLDKKKLDELVRQVAGAGDGAEAQSLQPDVEESMFQLADEFFDNVVSQACKMAKARNSLTLELRDIQLVLERYYNIRIPGYATDESRTVRKMQPAPPYLQKMNAVQAAKVMGGKTDV